MAICGYRECKVEFEPKKADHKFCSDRCRMKEWDCLHPRSFHNTIQLDQPSLFAANTKASNQEQEILAYFRNYPGCSFTPCEIHEHFSHWPITSVRRSITNLTVRGALVKTGEKRLGVYGLPNFCWKAA